MTLIGYWPLNEDSGDTAYDHSGNENHGTINDGGDSTIPGATGILGQNSYSFDGNNDYVSAGSWTDLPKSAEPRTLSLWLKADQRPSSKGQNYHVVNWGNNSDNESFGIYVNDPDDEIKFHIWSRDFSSGVVLEPNKWYNIVATYDGSIATIYVNGVEENSQSKSLNTAQSNFIIGRTPDGGDSKYTDGKISEVRVYDRPLTQNEIQYIYSTGHRGLQTTSKKSS